MSQEQALAELFRHAGTQFDPKLVDQFPALVKADQAKMRRELARRWLQELDSANSNTYWGYNPTPSAGEPYDTASLFREMVLDNMPDGVIFVDAANRVTGWNRGAEQLTGTSGPSIQQRLWSPHLLTMRDQEGNLIRQHECPLHCAMTSGVPTRGRFSILGRHGDPVLIDIHAIPVVDRRDRTLGGAMLLHDVSSMTSLEERCHTLHARATRDPLTNISNRSEFERVIAKFVHAFEKHKVICSLIICDLDHFKRVNDTHGHQAGDDVIVSMAKLLDSSCRPGDLVARYGGEEFVMLCADCDIRTVARRADQVRRALGEIEHPRLGGGKVTASFGVTQIQPGDTPEILVRRADRALLAAKEHGRNMVVRVGTGLTVRKEKKRRPFWRRTNDSSCEALSECDLVAPGPLKVAIEKVRGFIADHRAKVTRIENETLDLEIEFEQPQVRRKRNRPIALVVTLRFTEEQLCSRESSSSALTDASQIRIYVTCSPKSSRERRHAAMMHHARQISLSLRSYLMARDEALPADGTPRKVTPVCLPQTFMQG
jgi:diguanylate cyclase (GGDEF)-like protein